ncbi:FkbM family methyltransferase [Burkholderia sp. RF2-non_BP3]|uniref:FkbM family methyltransferase n=1 Tax=Burkholderia sp. RF2-non_BP3 TaxID=1637844 RepID=UPI000752AD14|nr:FkbM family methyltransferase [Burkholderia sp. RF2-non_BP3]KUY54293.1 hypothetical protein WS45_20610 [Burkholderia sp. RF2-non_BP3]
MERSVGIGGRRWPVQGNENDSYIAKLTDPFEPQLVSMLAVLCDNGAQVLDIGANIGCTALALSQIVGEGKVVAFEPVPRTFANLSKNVGMLSNVAIHNFALGSQAGTVPMQGSEGDSAGAFVANQFQIANAGYFQVEVPVRTLDEAFPSLGLDRIDFIKIDVEGFELDVFEGGRETLQRFKPRVVLEMNHFCLNMFRRITYPEFRERLLRIFPYVYAVDGTRYLDLTSENDAYVVGYEHTLQFRFPNLVAGFDRSDLIARLSTLDRAAHVLAEAHRIAADSEARAAAVDVNSNQLRQQLSSLAAERDCLSRQVVADSQRIAELERERNALLTSSSWRVTQPLRSIKRFFATKSSASTESGSST